MLSTYAQQTMVDTLPIAACVFIGSEYIINAANEPMLAIWAKDKSIIGKSLSEAFPELQDQSFFELLAQSYQTGNTFHDPNGKAELMLNGQQQTMYLNFSFKPLRDKEGQIYGVVNTAVDITRQVLSHQMTESLNQELATANNEVNAMNEELTASLEEVQSANHQLEEARRTAHQLRRKAEENEMRLHSILETMAEGMGLFDTEGKVYYFNQTAYQMLDLVPGSIRTRTYNDVNWINLRSDGSVLPLEEHPMHITLTTKQPVVGQEIALQLASGKRIDVLVNTAPLIDMRGRFSGGVATFMDITDRVEGNRLLKESEKRLQDANEELTAINEEQSAINEELRQTQDYLTTTVSQLSQSESNLRLTVEAANMGIGHMNIATGEVDLDARCREIYGLPAEGGLTIADVFATFDPLYLSMAQKALDEATLNKTVLDIEYEIIRPDTQKRAWLRTVGKLGLSADGNSTWFYGVVQDINQRKQEEQRKDDFISIASHELKTPVTSLKAALQLMDKMRDNPSKDMMPKLILQARKSVERVSTLIEDLLNVGRLQQQELPLRKSTFVLSQLLGACCNPLSITSGQKFLITGNTELEICADEHQVDQVVTNLVNNAVKYAPNSKMINLSVSNDNNFAKVSVTDYGPGIPPEKLAHLFDRYFRVHSSGNHVSGLGLGLFISYEIIRKHGGELTVESEVGRGTTFSFTLPFCADV